MDWLFGTPYPFARKVIINLKEGPSLSGVLWQRRAGWLVLRQATAHLPDGRTMQIDGDALVWKSDVLFIQVTPEGAK